jgi:hypothetical protein
MWQSLAHTELGHLSNSNRYCKLRSIPHFTANGQKSSSNRYSIAIFITIQSFISLLRTVEVEIENHSSSSNRCRRFGHPRHLPSGEISSLTFVFVVGFDFHIVGRQFDPICER